MAYLLQQLLAEGAERNGEKEAVWAHGTALTYRELTERSNQLAHLLRERGVTRGDRVGIFFPKAVESVISMFGALKAGAVYVPIDPHAPLKRAAYIARNCGIKTLITTAALARDLEPNLLGPEGFFVILDDVPAGTLAGEFEPWTSLSAFPASDPPECETIETDLAYILYTSGSTGEPKGVMLTHRNALAFVDWCADTFQIRPQDRLSNHAPLHFDLSVFDIYNSIRAGATVYLIPDDVSVFPASLSAFIEAHEITVWYSVPSALVYLLLRGNLGAHNLQRLRLVLFAGEPFPIKYLRQIAALLPHAELYNLYGPTETNVCTYYRVNRSELATLERLPIGKACANTEVFGVNDNGVPIRAGDTGELYVRGPSLTIGYWGDPEKTAKVLVPNRFRSDRQEYIYRTGDLVLLREDGNFDFLGRNDHMIKSRGYRIELGEIEATLYAHAAVREAAVIAIPDPEISNRIKAFLVPHRSGSVTKAEIQQHCAERIPKYMIPQIIEFCESLPKTSTGKVDRKRLAAAEQAVAGVG